VSLEPLSSAASASMRKDGSFTPLSSEPFAQNSIFGFLDATPSFSPSESADSRFWVSVFSLIFFFPCFTTTNGKGLQTLEVMYSHFYWTLLL